MTQNLTEIIQQTAKNENIVLTEQHMIVISLLQKFYQEFTLIPSTRALINYSKNNAKDLALDSILFVKLFPNGIAQACRIANLPPSPRCL